MSEDELRSQLQRERELTNALAAALKDLVNLVKHLNKRDGCNVKVAMHDAALAQHAASRSGKV